MKKKWMMATLGCAMVLSLVSAKADTDEDRRNYRDTHHRDRRGDYRDEQRRAQPPKPYVIQHRLEEQERTIYEKLRNGSLTTKEGRILKHNIAKIKTEFLRAEQDDEYISLHERKRLDRMLDRNKRMIDKQESPRVINF
ncbi:MAG: hypothetical protein C4516_10415 [Oxalobacter sp.]|nr:MAG: hypothetical protein C4516_10415 [Oxalobacter sp.]